MFVKREGEHFPGNVGHYPGTTMQEVLRVLIDRAKYVNSQIPCLETEMAIEENATCVGTVRDKSKKSKECLSETNNNRGRRISTDLQGVWACWNE